MEMGFDEGAALAAAEAAGADAALAVAALSEGAAAEATPICVAGCAATLLRYVVLCSRGAPLSENTFV